MQYFFINSRTPFEIRESLSRYGECIPLPPLETLPFPVSHHPDMLMAELDGTLFVHREYEKGQEILRSFGIPFRISEAPLGANYPRDVALNCFAVGDYLFANGKAVSRDVLAWAGEHGKTLLSVAQGYTKCSTVVAGGAIASADRGIIRAAQQVGIPALLLPPHPIGIEVYDTGFIGGACGLLDAKTLGFFGNIEAYPCYSLLRDFFASAGVEVLGLSRGDLFDFGGFFRSFLCEQKRTKRIARDESLDPCG